MYNKAAESFKSSKVEKAMKDQVTSDESDSDFDGEIIIKKSKKGQLSKAIKKKDTKEEKTKDKKDKKKVKKDKKKTERKRSVSRSSKQSSV